MQTTKQLTRAATLAAGVIGVIVASAPETALGRAGRKVSKRLARDARYVVASAPGIAYRLAGRQPDPEVADDVLADRIRSTIGALERRLDVPRVHVIVADHVAILHGEVTDSQAARAIEHEVLSVSGVRGVESHLHDRLILGDTKPSEGHASSPPSNSLQHLLDAAHAVGARYPAAAVRAVLCNFSDLLPDEERAHLFAHLPVDARKLATPPLHIGEQPRRRRRLPDFLEIVKATGGIEPDRAGAITSAVLGQLRTLVPEEARDIAAVLPADLRALWTEL